MTLFDPAQLPAHVKAAQAAGTTNIVTRGQVNSLTFPGKVWTVTIDGTERPLMRVNRDGEEELVQVFDAVVIAYNENRGRAYYGGAAYDQAQKRAPVCWSNDGITSSPNATERQSEKCNVCPQSVKGSRQTDQGKAAMACAQHRNLAVIPRSRDLATAPVLRLKIPQTSDFDGLNKEAQAKQMFAFTNYLNFLKSKQVPFTYSLTTKIRFDNTKPFPKLWFSPGRWLSEEETAACAEIAASDNLEDMLKTDFSGFGNAPRPPGVTEEDEAETTEIAEPAGEEEDTIELTPPTSSKPAPVAALAKPAPAPATPALVPAAAIPISAKARAAQKKAEAAAAAAAARKAAALADEDEEEEPAVAITSGRSSASVPAAVAPPQLDTILTDWDDE
jgi:hypothetical protein